jgi:hypothetical protein
VLHQKAEDITAFAATEAVKYLLVRADRKRWRFFGMKWAQTDKVLTRFLERYMLPDDIDNAARIPNFINFIFGNEWRQKADPPCNETDGGQMPARSQAV